MLGYGRGTVEWDAVLGALDEIGYEGPFNLEIPSRPGVPMWVLEAKLDYARALASYMVDQSERAVSG